MDEREVGAEAGAPPGEDSSPQNGAGSEREAIAPLDGRQIFFLFIGSALCACLIFAAGVLCGRRVERRAAAAAQTAPVSDPLAMLDEIANAEEALTFHRALLDRPSPRPRPSELGSEGEPTLAARGKSFGPPRPRFTLQSAPLPTKADAEALIRRLREAGYRPTLQTASAAPKPGQQYRLQVGDFPSPEIAQPLKSELFTRYQLRASVLPFQTTP